MAKTNQEVANAWVAGRASKNASMSTDGQTLWSYSTEIAWLDRQRRVAFLTPEMYSRTTSSKHMPAALSAVRTGEWRVLYGRGFEDWCARQNRLCAESFNMRCRKGTYPYVMQDIPRYQIIWNANYKLFNQTAPIIRPPVAWLQRAVRLGVEVPFDMWRLAYGGE